MTPGWRTLGLPALGYLSGSVPWGLVLTRAFLGVDVRERGSGNIGASNVARVGGARLGLLVLALDAAKGAAPVLLARALAPDMPAVWSAVGLAAFVGHVAPVWLGFRGGKGVATALGVVAVLAPWAALAGAGIYALVVTITRTSSMGSLLGGLGVLGVTAATEERWVVGLVAVLFLGMLFTHRSNLRRLLRGRENRIG